MLLLGSGLVGLAGYGRKKLLRNKSVSNLRREKAGSFGSAFFFVTTFLSVIIDPRSGPQLKSSR